MAVQIQWRRGTAAAWTSANPTLAQGEIGLETDTNRVKVGDGTTAWVSLAYAFETTGGHTLREAGSPLTSRAYMNFLAGFDLADDAGGGETEIALDASEVSGAPTSVDIADTQTTGASASFANADHIHAHPAPGATYPVDSVIGTEADGTATTPARSDHQHSITAPATGYPTDVATAEADGSSANPARADHVHAHGSGYLADAHHARAHDHSNSSDTTALVPESVEITGGPLALRGDISPTQLAANTDNYAPTGLADAVVLRLSTDASRNLTGITGGADGRLLLVLNVGSFPLVLKHDVTSTAGNRFYCPGDVDVALDKDAGVWVAYDATASRWRVVDVVVLGTNVPNPVGTAAAGTATLASHQDHIHASGAGTPSTQAFGDAAVVGSGPAASMTDHKHAMPADPLSGTVALTGDISPPQLTASVNDYSPTGLSSASVLRLDSNAQWNITGLAGGADGRILFLYNIGSFNIMLPTLSASSASANRFQCGDNLGSARLGPGETVMLVYDSTGTKWRVAPFINFVTTATANIGLSDTGTAGSVSHSDHVHATGAGTPSTQAFGDAAAVGSGPAASMTDHKHGMPTSVTGWDLVYELATDMTTSTSFGVITDGVTPWQISTQSGDVYEIEVDFVASNSNVTAGRIQSVELVASGVCFTILASQCNGIYHDSTGTLTTLAATAFNTTTTAFGATTPVGIAVTKSTDNTTPWVSSFRFGFNCTAARTVSFEVKATTSPGTIYAGGQFRVRKLKPV